MCGIVGYVGERECKELLLEGLERLEYRGYDSAGICLINGQVDIVRRVGRVQDLRAAVGSAPHPATMRKKRTIEQPRPDMRQAPENHKAPRRRRACWC